ncbi:O-methyltransferase [Flavobacterium sp. CS20]|jgi:predicted O-methyltransferase YrrM|uniref:O-methyltransferase n=1 Tax=Flavobacterium sp. CS20 TaxID=2775246 RepID=UPI001B39F02C|nr:O-methyltransferase [Flavobacterium sp. CS20]QTY26923.1 O-methyltransferase [Flavobacterium sp. CS20]
MKIIDKSIEAYSIEHSENEPKFLKALAKETWQKVLQPRMLSGAYQGRLLSLISKIVAPSCILEIGTYTGYSSLCLAEGLAENGVLHTIDVNEELVDIQQKHFKNSPFYQNIKTHLGDAQNIIPKIDAKFDLVFIDADKQNYSLYLDLVMPKLNPKAVILSDNVLWDGKVVNPQIHDEDTLALRAYNEKLITHSQLETVLLPIRDGLSISRLKD